MMRTMQGRMVGGSNSIRIRVFMNCSEAKSDIGHPPLCSASGAAAAALPVRTDFYPEIQNTNNKKR